MLYGYVMIVLMLGVGLARYVFSGPQEKATGRRGREDFPP